MKNRESVGFVVGALVGTILTGICVYLTSSPLSSWLTLLCTLIGGRIGKSINVNKDEQGENKNERI